MPFTSIWLKSILAMDMMQDGMCNTDCPEVHIADTCPILGPCILPVIVQAKSEIEIRDNYYIGAAEHVIFQDCGTLLITGEFIVENSATLEMGFSNCTYDHLTAVTLVKIAKKQKAQSAVYLWAYHNQNLKGIIILFSLGSFEFA